MNKIVDCRLITAMAKNRVIGCDNHLPWHIPAELQHFRRQTKGHLLLIGHSTYRSMGVLPDRVTVVLSRNLDHSSRKQVVFFNEPEKALAWANHTYPDKIVWIAGGQQIYALMMPWVKQMVITSIDQIIAGDAWFPDIDWSNWSLVAKEPHLKEPIPYWISWYQLKDKPIAA